MTPTAIILLVVAVIVLVLSFFVVDRSNSQHMGKKSGSLSGGISSLSEKDIKDLKKQAEKVLETAVSDSVIEADDKMSKISNEKIMAVNEFASQLLEKIEQNNEQVVFLYNMLTQKEEEIKTTYSKMDTIRRENKEFLEKLSSLMSAKSKAKQPGKSTDSLITPSAHNGSDSAQGDMASLNSRSVDSNAMSAKALNESPALNQQANGLKMEEDSKDTAAGKTTSARTSVTTTETLSDSDSYGHDSLFEHLQFDEAAVAIEEEKANKNDQILALHKQKKSILEISRQLNLGQGEVKLVIDLYGR